jgi:hypothetical protein
MAIERAILENMHRAIDTGEFDQISSGRMLLDYLNELKESGFIDYSATEMAGNSSSGPQSHNLNSPKLSLSEKILYDLLISGKGMATYEQIAQAFGRPKTKNTTSTLASRLRQKLLRSNPPQDLKKIGSRGYQLIDVQTDE